MDSLDKNEENLKQLLYMQLNIRSLPKHFDEFKTMLASHESQNYKPDIILLCETWLNDMNAQLFPGYEFIEQHVQIKSKRRRTCNVYKKWYNIHTM